MFTDNSATAGVTPSMGSATVRSIEGEPLRGPVAAPAVGPAPSAPRVVERRCASRESTVDAEELPTPPPAPAPVKRGGRKKAVKPIAKKPATKRTTKPATRPATRSKGKSKGRAGAPQDPEASPTNVVPDPEAPQSRWTDTDGLNLLCAAAMAQEAQDAARRARSAQEAVARQTALNSPHPPTLYRPDPTPINPTNPFGLATPSDLNPRRGKQQSISWASTRTGHVWDEPPRLPERRLCRDQDNRTIGAANPQVQFHFVQNEKARKGMPMVARGLSAPTEKDYEYEAKWLDKILEETEEREEEEEVIAGVPFEKTEPRLAQLPAVRRKWTSSSEETVPDQCERERERERVRERKPTLKKRLSDEMDAAVDAGAAKKVKVAATNGEGQDRKMPC